MNPSYFSCFPAGDSGKVHSTVKERWTQQDPELCDGMLTLGRLADQAVESLKAGDINKLACLMDQNFGAIE